MELTTSSQETTTTTSSCTVMSATQEQQQQFSKKLVLPGNLLTSGQFPQQQHHHSSSYSHVLSSPTSSNIMECVSPLGGTPETPGYMGKITASTSFSGSSSRSISHHGSTSSGGGKQPLQDSEDSSYDSDCEVSDATTSHNDVSRTVSDTLGQEFEEYVTISSRGQQTVGIGSSSNLINSGASGIESFQLNTEDPGYKSKLEFANKLGYTEIQVQIVLSKLGPTPSQNELLNELILLDDNSGLNKIISTVEPTEGTGGGNVGPTAGSVGGSSGSPSQSSNNLRHIVIDGSNIAMTHGNNEVFSCRGIKLAVDYFKTRGHKEITVFVPLFRKETPKPDDPVTDQHILTELETEGILIYTPSRLLKNRRLICYDDRYILKLAVEVDGIVVSNDNYRDLTNESLDFKRIVEEKLLMYIFVNDRFMPPDDPLGRNGRINLDQFLSKSVVTQLPPPCPYDRKCTYGTKCKYYHSTQAKSVSETLRKQAMKTQSVPIALTSNQAPVCRTRSAVVPMESSKDLSVSTMGANPHRKLQRQLSINPVGDPRVHQTFQRGASLNPSLHSLFPPQDSYSLSPFPGNPALSEVWKPADWSLPGSGRAQNSQSQDDWMKAQRSHLPTAPVRQQPSQLSPQLVAPTPSSFPSSSNSNRTTMYYHLAAIFPEHQVKHVMDLYPDCNDPSFICRQIVSIFK